MSTMTINEVKKYCEELQKANKGAFKDACAKCDYWKVTRGCEFYRRPLDWQIKGETDGK